jgi:hypothetical protein
MKAVILGGPPTGTANGLVGAVQGRPTPTGPCLLGEEQGLDLMRVHVLLDGDDLAVGSKHEEEAEVVL